jgi:hypothetical protein
MAPSVAALASKAVSMTRYKLSPDEIMRRRRYGDLRKLFHDRYGQTFPDDDAGNDDLFELLLPVSLAPYDVRPGATNQTAGALDGP